MTDDDLDAVVALEQAVFSDPWQRSFFRADLHRPVGLMLVAEQDGRLLGYAVAWGGEETHIANLAVAPGERRQGIGTKLVRACLREASKLEVERVFVLTYVPGFFQDLGFRRVDRTELPHRIWAECVRCPQFPDCDELAMVIDLPKPNRSRRRGARTRRRRRTSA